MALGAVLTGVVAAAGKVRVAGLRHEGTGGWTLIPAYWLTALVSRCPSPRGTDVRGGGEGDEPRQVLRVLG